MEDEVGNPKDMNRAAQGKLKAQSSCYSAWSWDVFDTLPKMIPFPNVKMLGFGLFPALPHSLFSFHQLAKLGFYSLP